MIVTPVLDDPILSRVEYTITLQTGDLKGASSDGNVYIEIFGELGSSGRQTLTASSAQSFERNSTDVFRICCKDLGMLQKICISHDGKVSTDHEINPSQFFSLGAASLQHFSIAAVCIP